MLLKNEITGILTQAGVLMEGHFLLTSGMHSDKYLQCARIFRNVKYSEKLCAELASRFIGMGVDAVIGPAMGAVQMAYEVSRHLDCENFFTERENGKMLLRRGFEILPSMKCLVVEDVVTTGGSVKEVIEIVRRAGAQLVGVGVIVDRSGGKADFGVPLSSVLSLDVNAWQPDRCPLCEEGKIALTKPGSRKI